MSSATSILEIQGLKTYFETARGTIKAVDGVDLSLEKGDTLGVVGESGGGKTVRAVSIMKLVPKPAGRIVAGKIIFNGTDLVPLNESSMRGIRGKDISMIFQEPMTSLNPVLKIGDQVSEVIRIHQGLSAREALEQAVDILRMVGIPAPEQRAGEYPHQMSGGMRQRVIIAMAIACRPKLILADEPTTALDVTIQAQILDILNKLKEELETSVVLITHDLGVIAETARNVAVMYAGKVVEYSDVKSLFSDPLHPYTEGLLQSVPKINKLKACEENGYLKTIPGSVPSLYSLPPGCSFQDRCPVVMEKCRREEPFLKEVSSGHFSRCWRCI
jgi:peptide/nickel transport system ATP-binding protein/oligopeptide transport system ATP-binding protein